MSEPRQAIAALLELMARLRDPQQGCPWDREQTFATIAPYTIEEAYEVADAIAADDPQKLREELGDLLFQVVFHARLAEERGWFDFAAVAESIHSKLVRRHPHVFGDAVVLDAQQQSHVWEQQKAQERAAAALKEGSTSASALADVPRALPALARAAKLGRRAARVGFDWAAASDVREKVLEELREVDEAVRQQAHAAAQEELGDLLFAVANWSRHLKVDPEEALRGANAKFQARFEHMEALASAQGLSLERLSAAEWDALWRQAKIREPGRGS
jgi:MazG family protein